MDFCILHLQADNFEADKCNTYKEGLLTCKCIVELHTSDRCKTEVNCLALFYNILQEQEVHHLWWTQILVDLSWDSPDTQSACDMHTMHAVYVLLLHSLLELIASDILCVVVLIVLESIHHLEGCTWLKDLYQILFS